MSTNTPADEVIRQQRRTERETDEIHDRRMLRRHRAYLSDARDAEATDRLRREASLQLDQLDASRTHHTTYLLAWRRILALPWPEFVAEVLREDDVGLTYRQSSPFAHHLVAL